MKGEWTMNRRSLRDALVAACQVLLGVLLLAVAIVARAEAAAPDWTRDFTARDLEFFKPTASEDPTGLTRVVTVGVLYPDRRAFVMLSVEQWSNGERVGLRRRVRHLAMPLDELLALVIHEQRGPRRPGSLGGPPAVGGMFQFYEGFAGFPERQSNP